MKNDDCKTEQICAIQETIFAECNDLKNCPSKDISAKMTIQIVSI